MVIVAIPSIGNGGLNDEMSPRFGRCATFTFVELVNNKIEVVRVVKNHASDAMGGAGVQASQIVGENKADIVIVGFLGPNAAMGLNSLNLKILHAPDKKITIKEVIELYIQGSLQEITSANVGAHRGMGGRGMGGGLGRQV